ncbi:MAG: hypothetical protein ACP5OG_03020 [Candidatus Nanoarchaeia archaeon]
MSTNKLAVLEAEEIITNATENGLTSSSVQEYCENLRALAENTRKEMRNKISANAQASEIQKLKHQLNFIETLITDNEIPDPNTVSCFFVEPLPPRTIAQELLSWKQAMKKNMPIDSGPCSEEEVQENNPEKLQEQFELQIA